MGVLQTGEGHRTRSRPESRVEVTSSTRISPGETEQGDKGVELGAHRDAGPGEGGAAIEETGGKGAAGDKVVLEVRASEGSGRR